jgi:DNA-binding transcriptional LysR family regulator
MDATIELDSLAFFVRVAEHRSFTKAARELGVPTSTVSRAVARLEDRLGARLVQRTTRKLALTAEGAALFEGARAPLRALSTVAHAVGDARGAPRGTLRLTAPADMGSGITAEVVGGFIARYPAVRIDMVLTNRMVDLVEEGFDGALRAGTLVDSSLVALKLGDTPGRWFASPEYLARRGTPTSPADLANHDGVLFRSPRGPQKWIFQNGDGEAIEVEPAVRVVGDDFGFVRGVVREGAGIGLMPALLTVEDVAAGRLVRVLPAYERLEGALFFVYPTARHVPAKVTAFRDFAVERFRTLWGRRLP